MSILESIKEERKLSLNNWRYRLLHWCFNEKCETPQESELPSFLYTHYCPLFHLTNFIALLSPFILGFKVMSVVFVALFKAVGEILNKIDWSFLEREVVVKKKIVREPTEEEKKQEQWGHLFHYVSRHYRSSFDYDNPPGFEEFWEDYKYGRFDLLDKEEVHEKYKVYYARIKEVSERAATRKKRMRDTIIFWVNFSRAFVKWILYAFYIGVGLGALWLLSVSVMPVFYAVSAFFSWIFSFEVASVLPLLVFAGKCGLVGCGILCLLAVFHKFGVAQRCACAIGDGIVTCMMPVSLAGRVIAAPFKFAFKGCCAFREFAVMFYEENCPPITIVSEQEEDFEEEVA